MDKKRVKLHIKNWRFRVILGVFEEERHHPRNIHANLTLDLDAFSAVASDDLFDTVCYASLIRSLEKAVIQDKPYRLLESLAGHLLDHVAQYDPKIIGAHIAICKPAPFESVEEVWIEHSFTRSQ